MSCLEIISVLKDIIITIAAIITGSVAIYGINSWKKQLKGKTYFETSKELLLKTYKLRDAIQASRLRITYAYEFPEKYSKNTKHTPKEEGEAWSQVYTNRMKPVYDRYQEFEILTLEAETIWGDEIKVRTDRLKNCVISLRNAMDMIVDDKISPGVYFNKENKLRKEMYDKVLNNDNEVTSEIYTAVEDIEILCKKYLK